MELDSAASPVACKMQLPPGDRTPTARPPHALQRVLHGSALLRLQGQLLQLRHGVRCHRTSLPMLCTCLVVQVRLKQDLDYSQSCSLVFSVGIVSPTSELAIYLH